MAEGDGAIYNNFKEQVLNGAFNLGTDTIKVILVSAHSPDIDTHTQYSDVSSDEYGAGSGYTVGGETLGGQSVTQDNTNDRAVFDGNDVQWSSLGPLSPAIPSHAIMYSVTASNLLMCYWEIGTTGTNGGNWTLSFDAVGIMTLT